MNVNDKKIRKLYSDRMLKVVQASKELVDSSQFQDEVRVFRQKWGIAAEGFGDIGSEVQWYDKRRASDKPMEEFGKDMIQTFISTKQYGLHENSQWPLRAYILNNKYECFWPAMPGVEVIYDDDQEYERSYMEFYDHTTEAELLEAFRYHRLHQTPTEPRHALPPIKHDKMRMAYALHSNGMKSPDIAVLIDAEFGGEHTYSEINAYLRTYKKRLIK